MSTRNFSTRTVTMFWGATCLCICLALIPSTSFAAPNHPCEPWPGCKDDGGPTLEERVMTLEGDVETLQDDVLDQESRISTLEQAANESAVGAIIIHALSYSPQNTPTILSISGVQAEYRMPRSGTIQNMRFFVSGDDISVAVTVTLYVNGNPTVLSEVIGAAENGPIDVAGMVEVVDGDRIAVFAEANPLGNGTGVFTVSYEFK